MDKKKYYSNIDDVMHTVLDSVAKQFNVVFPLNANGNIFTRCLYMYFKHVYNKRYVDVIVGVY